MKKWILIIVLILIYTCKQPQDSLIGDWIVNSKFYQATYQIIEEKSKWNAIVLYYNDGTTKYTFDGTKKRYAFKGLIKNNTTYVDGISGATTSTEGKSQTIEINKKSRDTLEVTTYSMSKPIVELWIRKK